MKFGFGQKNYAVGAIQLLSICVTFYLISCGNTKQERVAKGMAQTTLCQYSVDSFDYWDRTSLFRQSLMIMNGFWTKYPDGKQKGKRNVAITLAPDTTMNEHLPKDLKEATAALASLVQSFVFSDSARYYDSIYFCSWRSLQMGCCDSCFSYSVAEMNRANPITSDQRVEVFGRVLNAMVASEPVQVKRLEDGFSILIPRREDTTHLSTIFEYESARYFNLLAVYLMLHDSKVNRFVFIFRNTDDRGKAREWSYSYDRSSQLLCKIKSKPPNAIYRPNIYTYGSGRY